MMVDLADDFSKVGEMVQLARQSADVVCASRYMKGGRQIGGPRLKGLLSRMAGVTPVLAGRPSHPRPHQQLQGLSPRFSPAHHHREHGGVLPRTGADRQGPLQRRRGLRGAGNLVRPGGRPQPLQTLRLAATLPALVFLGPPAPLSEWRPKTMSKQSKGQPADSHAADSAGRGAGNSEDSAKTAPAAQDPQAVDQSLRQAVSLCGRMLPDDQKNAAGVEREVRRLMNGILADLHEDPEAFGVAAPAASAQRPTRKRLLALLQTLIGPHRAAAVGVAGPAGLCGVYNLYGSSIGWNQPILDAHGFRQTQTAINVYYMLHGSPRIYEDPVLGPPWASPYEFPIFQWTVATIAGLFGTPLDQTGRFVSLVFFWSVLPIVYRLLRSLGLSRALRLVVVSILLVSPHYIFWSRAFMMETTAVLLGMACLAFVFTYEEKRQARWLVLASVFAILAALAKVTTFATFLAAAWLAVAYFRLADWKQRGWALTLVTRAAVTLAAVTLPAVVAIAWWTHATDLVKAANPLGEPNTSAGADAWVFGTVAERLTLDTWRVIFGRVTHFEYPWWLLLACLVCLIVAWRRWLVVAACLLLYLTAPLAFTNLHFIHTYYACANLIFLVTALALCVVALLERTGWRRWLGVAALLAVIGVSVHSHQTTYAGLQRSNGWLTIAAAKAVNRITEANEVMLGCGFDWSPEIPYYAGRRALMFPKWATGKTVAQAFQALNSYKIGAAVVSMEPNFWEGEYAKQFRAALAENLQRHGLSRFPSCSIGAVSVFPAARYEKVCHALALGKQYREKRQMAEAIAALDETIAGLPGEPEPYVQARPLPGIERANRRRPGGLRSCPAIEPRGRVRVLSLRTGLPRGGQRRGRDPQPSRMRGWSEACRS